MKTFDAPRADGCVEDVIAPQHAPVRDPHDLDVLVRLGRPEQLDKAYTHVYIYTYINTFHFMKIVVTGSRNAAVERS